MAHKERRACDYENPTAGWTREKYDARVAQILVQYENVVYAALPNMDACVERVCVTHAEIARRRNEKPISMIQFLGEKSHDYMDGSTQKKQKDDITPSDYFLRALTRISGVTAAHARGVVARYRSMDALMRAYADPTTSVEDKRRMLEDIMPLAAVSRDGTAARPGGKNRFGPAKSARVYDFFKPLAPRRRRSNSLEIRPGLVSGRGKRTKRVDRWVETRSRARETSRASFSCNTVYL